MLLLPLLAFQPVWKADPHEIILHRSAGMAAPENTIPALEQAVLQGADGVEIDLRRTRDGQWVLYHDDWLILDAGPGAKLEELTLAEARSLDAGRRWGPQWAGLQVPLVKDVLQFARANRLLLFLDIKTKGFEDELRGLVAEAGVQSQIIEPAPFRPAGRRALPWIEGWNYLDGGEEDPAVMTAAARRARQPRRFMTDDARALAAALGRRPDRRRFVRFQDTGPARTAMKAAELRSREELWRTARTSSEPRARLQALWGLGAAGTPADLPEILAWAAEPDAPNPAEHPLGMAYYDTFRKAAAACAIARIGERGARQAAEGSLVKLADSPGLFTAPAAVLAASAFGSDSTILFLMDLHSGDSGAQQMAMSHAARHPLWRQIALRALARAGMTARQGTFLLADSLQGAEFAAEALDRPQPEAVRRRLALALRWAQPMDRDRLLNAVEVESRLALLRRLAARQHPDVAELILGDSGE